MSAPTKTRRRITATMITELTDWSFDEPFSEEIDVTPDLAQRWLARDNADVTVYNRNPSIPRVDRYARDMTNDLWLFTGFPIVLDRNGHVRDGGQRLLAIIKSGKTIRFNVWFGIDPEAQKVMDRNRTRTNADDYRIRGVKYSSTVAAAASLVIRWQARKLFTSGWTPSTMEIDQVMDASAHTELKDAAEVAVCVYEQLHSSTKSVMAAGYFQAHQLAPNSADEFFQSLIMGANLNVDDPILVLRNTIERYPNRNPRARQTHQLFHLVRAWNLFREGTTIRGFVLPKNMSSEAFPFMV